MDRRQEGYAGEDGPDLETGLAAASRLVEDDDPESALRLLLDLEPGNARDATLLCMIGVVAEHLGAEGMAADYFRRCLAEEPTDPGLLVRAGAGLAPSGDPAAEPALRLAALTAPEMPAARLQYGIFLVRSGLVDQGMDELRAARDLDPQDPDVHRQIAVAHLLAGRTDEAATELEAAMALDDDDPDTRLMRGLVLLQAGDVETAAEELHPVADVLADDAQTQLILALTFALVDWMDDAWLALSRAEAAPVPADLEIVRDVEEALESDAEAIRSLLLTELAPSALRDLIHTR